MYTFIYVEFIPISSTGSDSLTNSISISTASQIISLIRSFESLLTKCWYKRQAKSVCKPSSLEISSLLKASPGIRPLFFSQKIAQKLPEKKMPSIAAKATSLSANENVLNHLNAHSALSLTLGIVSIAVNKNPFSY